MFCFFVQKSETYGGKLLSNFETVLKNTVVGNKSFLVLELVSRILLSRPDHRSK